MIREMMLDRGISAYRLAKMTEIPYMTVNDLCNGKSDIEKCSAMTVYRIAKALGVSMEELIEDSAARRPAFELFKSNVCHRLKEMGDIAFLRQTLSENSIREYQKKKWYAECLYLLAMVDYISRVNRVPLCADYDDLRRMKLSDTVYPAGVLSLALAEHSDGPKRRAWEEAIPEFKRFNIVEGDVRDVI